MEENVDSSVIVTKTSKKAIASLILGILNLYGLGTILSIILGHMARAEIKKSNGSLTGKVLALTGLIISYFTLVIALFILVLAILKVQARS